jgi:D-beta-D-heptose 7-phosphate kinase/D-beta-D-heptose 1-phosphate adenosyltransferase
MNKIISPQSLLDSNTHDFTFVSGVFDLLHPGHLHMLHKAKNEVPEHKLVVAAINDADVRERKGPGRPVYNLAERSDALSYLADVDFVIPWEEPWQKLREFVLKLKPKILVVVEGDPGTVNKREIIETVHGRLVELPREPGYSTTELIRKIRELQDAQL